MAVFQSGAMPGWRRCHRSPSANRRGCRSSAGASLLSRRARSPTARAPLKAPCAQLQGAGRARQIHVQRISAAETHQHSGRTADREDPQPGALAGKCRNAAASGAGAAPQADGEALPREALLEETAATTCAKRAARLRRLALRIRDEGAVRRASPQTRGAPYFDRAGGRRDEARKVAGGCARRSSFG
ncbi:hypothetical protein ACU4GD_15620 [Cupriavidus basilensis]